MFERLGNRSYGRLFAVVGGLAAGGFAVASAIPVLKRRVTRATTLLKKDHRMVSGLFWTLEQSSNPSIRKSVFNQIENQLEMHAQAEEEIFYPAIRSLRTADAESQVDEANQEHGRIKDLCRQISNHDPISNEFQTKVRELKDIVEHHVQEEESEMFELARRSMSNRELEQLGQRIHNRKKQLKERIAA